MTSCRRSHIDYRGAGTESAATKMESAFAKAFSRTSHPSIRLVMLTARVPGPSGPHRRAIKRGADVFSHQSRPMSPNSKPFIQNHPRPAASPTPPGTQPHGYTLNRQH